MKILYAVTSVFFLFCSNIIYADGLFKWHSRNVQLLHGTTYEVGDDTRTIGTFEYANAGAYGDFFMFIDYIKPGSGASGYYSEFSTRFSLSNLSGKKLAKGLLEDVSLALALEKPKNNDRNLLAGIGTRWSLPGFTFFNVNVYNRDNPNLPGSTEQVTIAWSRPFTIGQCAWLSEGFVDIAGGEGGAASNVLAVPRLLLDIGSLSDSIPVKKWWFGVEYSYL